MPRTSFNQSFKINLDTDIASQVVPVLGSQAFRRFSIQIENAGAGVATLMGALSGNQTRVSVSDLMDSDGNLDHAIPSSSGYSNLLDSAGVEVFTGLGNGLYHLEISTMLPGGLLLDFTGITDAGGDTATVTVLMSGNATITGAPRGA